VYEASTDTFTSYWSPDGVSWIPGPARVIATLTISHFGFALSSWGSAGKQVASLEYIAAYNGTP
jgi:hypothetical protein